MRRHTLVFRALKKRFRLTRPRYSLRVLLYGGATFTMLLFVLLLMSSGLMYFYFEKSRRLERELVKWRAGMKTYEEPALVTTTKPPIRDTVQNLTATLRTKIIGMPEPEEAGNGQEASASASEKRHAQQRPVLSEAGPQDDGAEMQPVEPRTRSEVAQARSAAAAKFGSHTASDAAPQPTLHSAYDMQQRPSPEDAQRDESGDREPAPPHIQAPKHLAAPRTTPESGSRGRSDAIGSFLKSQETER